MRSDLSPAFLAALDDPEIAVIQYLVFYFDSGNYYVSDHEYEYAPGKYCQALVASWGDLTSAVDSEKSASGTGIPTQQMGVKLFNTSTLGWFSNNFGNAPHNVQVDVHQVLYGVGDVVIAKMLAQAPIGHSESSITISLDLVSINQYTDQAVGTFNQTTGEYLPLPVGNVKFVPAQLYGSNPLAVLTDNIDSSSTQIVTDRDLIKAGFPAVGSIDIDFDVVSYSGIGGPGNNIFTGVSGLVNQHDSGQHVLKKAHPYTFALCSGPVASVNAVYFGGQRYAGPYTVNTASGPVTITFSSMPFYQEDKFIDGTFDQVVPPASLDYYELGCKRKSDSESGYSYYTIATHYVGAVKLVKCDTIGTNSIPATALIVEGWVSVEAEIWRVPPALGKTAANPTIYIRFGGVGSELAYSTSSSNPYSPVSYIQPLTHPSQFSVGNSYFYVKLTGEAEQDVNPDVVFFKVKSFSMFARYKYQDNGFPKKKYYIDSVAADISTGDVNPAGLIYNILTRQGLSNYVDSNSYQDIINYYNSISYTYNGLAPGEKSIKDALCDAMEQCRCSVVYRGDKIRFYANKHLENLPTLYKSNSNNRRARSISVDWQDISSSFNKLCINFNKNSLGNIFIQSFSISDPASEAVIGRYEKKLDYYLIDNSAMAEDLAEFNLSEKKFPRQIVSFVAYLDAFAVEMYDRIALYT